jgi:hypothetical protein
MSDKHRAARLAKRLMRTGPRLQDAYIDGVTDDDALDTQQAYDEYGPAYEGDLADGHLDEMIPF